MNNLSRISLKTCRILYYYIITIIFSIHHFVSHIHQSSRLVKTFLHILTKEKYQNLNIASQHFNKLQTMHKTKSSSIWFYVFYLLHFKCTKGGQQGIALFICMKKIVTLASLIFCLLISPLNIVYASVDNLEDALNSADSSVVIESSSGEIPLGKDENQKNAPYKVMVSDRALLTEPIVSEDAVLVPIKELAKALKINIDWISEDQTIMLEKAGKYLHLAVGKKQAFMNGRKTDLIYTAIIKNGISFVPLSLIAETFGYETFIDSSNKTIKIDSISSTEEATSVSNSVYYYANSEPIKLKDIKVIDNKTYVNSVDFDLLTQHKVDLEFFPDSRILNVNGSATYIDTKTEYIDNRIYVPLSTASKGLGMKIFWGANTKTVHIYHHNLSVKPQRNIEELVPEHFVYGSINDRTPLYYSIGGKVNTNLPKGKVEIVRDKDYKWYYVKSGNISGWTKREYLSIDTKFEPSKERLTDSESEYFVNNYFKLSSPTDYLIWVDLKKQLINIFTRNDGKWEVEKKYPCASGKNISPTPKGTYSISSNRGKWMHAGGSVWVKNYVGFYSSYFFHSVKVKKDGELYDGTLGTVASAGCIRMPVEESEWFTNNIPEKTTVFIH